MGFKISGVSAAVAGDTVGSAQVINESIKEEDLNISGGNNGDHLTKDTGQAGGWKWEAPPSPLSTPVAISDGGTGAATVGGAQTNLQIVPSTGGTFTGDVNMGTGATAQDVVFANQAVKGVRWIGGEAITKKSGGGILLDGGTKDINIKGGDNLVLDGGIGSLGNTGIVSINGTSTWQLIDASTNAVANSTFRLDYLGKMRFGDGSGAPDTVVGRQNTNRWGPDSGDWLYQAQDPVNGTDVATKDYVDNKSKNRNVLEKAVGYTLVNNDDIVVATVTGITLNLPATPANGQAHTLHRRAVGGPTVTVAGNGNTINGSASISLSNNDSYDLVYFAGTINEWRIV